MKWLVALMLALGVLVASTASQASFLADKEKDEAKKDGDKDGKKDGDKDGKKDGGKKEDPKLTPAQEKDLKDLTGSYSVEKYTREGKDEAAAQLKKMKVVQKGAEWKFYVGEDITLGKDTVYPDKSPKEVDSLYINGPAREKTAKGIYKIEGDTVTFAHADPGKDRPKSFDSGKEGSGITVIVLKKMKDDPPLDGEKDGKKDGKKDGDKDGKKDGDKDGKKDGDKDK
jgi:uncharacterized protein (TIGR03067 family)